MPERFDVIELNVDLSELGLHAGQQSTLVHRHSADEFEVELTSDAGETIACALLSVDQFIVVWTSASQEWVGPTETSTLLETIAQADRGEVISGEDLLHDLRREIAQR